MRPRNQLWRLLGILLLALCPQSQALFAAPTPPLAPEFIQRESERLEALLLAIDLDYPGLETVREARQRQDTAAAAQALVDYYTTKQWPPELLALLNLPATTISAQQLQEADALLEDTFTLQRLTARQPRRPDGGLDWEYGGPKNDREWAWMLNRHHWAHRLMQAGLATDDPRYIETLDAHLADWVLANPYPARMTYSAPWRPLEVARRIDRSWIEVFVMLHDHPKLRPQTRLLMLSSLLEHADSLSNFHSPSGNHLLTELVMLGKLGAYFPEFRDAARWREQATTEVLHLIEDQTYPDGTYKELANHYQRIAARSFQTLYDLLVASDSTHEAARLRPRLELMWQNLLLVMRPNGTGPLNNDSDLDLNRQFVAEVWQTFNRPDWHAILNHDLDNITTAPTHLFPWAGHAVMRSDWSPQALWAFFDMGPQGTQHEHEDRLHLSLSLGQQDFLVDAGRYTYQQGPLRDYFQGPSGHNVVLLNGHGTAPPPMEVQQPLPIIADITPQASLFLATARFPETATSGGWHSRAVYFAPPHGWIVLDEIIAFGPHELTTLWHFAPEIAVTQRQEHLWQATSPRAGSLLLKTVAITLPGHTHATFQSGVLAPRPAGWHSPEFNKRLPAIEMNFQVKSRGPSLRAWLLAPSNQALDALSKRLTNATQGPRPLRDNPPGVQDFETPAQIH